MNKPPTVASFLRALRAKPFLDKYNVRSKITPRGYIENVIAYRAGQIPIPDYAVREITKTLTTRYEMPTLDVVETLVFIEDSIKYNHEQKNSQNSKTRPR